MHIARRSTRRSSWHLEMFWLLILCTFVLQKEIMLLAQRLLLLLLLHKEVLLRLLLLSCSGCGRHSCLLVRVLLLLVRSRQVKLRALACGPDLRVLVKLVNARGQRAQDVLGKAADVK